jgi:threonine synthase
MKYISTKHQSPAVSLEAAVLNSLPPDKGLYLPESLPMISPELLERLPSLSFPQVALEIAQLMLGDDIPREILVKLVSEAFNFPIEIHRIKEKISCLELFHGPTCAFKDFAARFMAQLMAYYVKDSSQQLTILVATSGDTGGAVADAFFGIDNIRVVILYPHNKVSKLQEAQLNSYSNNVTAIAVEGTFDDCQALVKQAFHDQELNTKVRLASANSINIARLIPQMFYYVYAAAQLDSKQHPLAISVPSGNFGNLTAAVLAKKIGAPIEHFIAACNLNDTIPRFFQTGRYEPKPARPTLSNAMDVSDPSNFQRLMYLYQDDLTELKQDITAFSFSDDEVLEAIRECYSNHNYTLDPHSAIGYLGLKSYDLQQSQGLIAATAHPAKFLDAFDNTHRQAISLPPQLATLLDYQAEIKSIPANYLKIKSQITY